jgi:hypothetical protein
MAEPLNDLVPNTFAITEEELSMLPANAVHEAAATEAMKASGFYAICAENVGELTDPEDRRLCLVGHSAIVAAVNFSQQQRGQKIPEIAADTDSVDLFTARTAEERRRVLVHMLKNEKPLMELLNSLPENTEHNLPLYRGAALVYVTLSNVFYTRQTTDNLLKSDFKQ